MKAKPGDITTYNGHHALVLAVQAQDDRADIAVFKMNHAVVTSNVPLDELPS